MWLYRGVQSAVFYYASCAPCGNYLYKRKRKREAARTPREPSGDGLVTDQPVVFQQAIPFTTNTYWEEEITLGPGPPSRKAHKNGGNRTNSQKNLAPLEEEEPASEPFAGALHALKKEKDALTKPIGDAWNRIRYQREEEELWGVEVKGSSVGLSGRGRTDTAVSSKYYISRSTLTADDIYPPVISGPRSKEETRWMLQPPPSAKIMEGKVRCGPSIRHSRGPSPGRRQLAILEEPFIDDGTAISVDIQSLNRSPTLGPILSNDGPTTQQSSVIAARKTSASLSADTLLPPVPPSFSSVAWNSRHACKKRSRNDSLSDSPPVLTVRSNSPNSRSSRHEVPNAPPPALLRKTVTTHFEDRPSTNETVDSGKSFRLQPSTPTWVAHNNKTSNNKLDSPYFGVQLDMDSDSFFEDDLNAEPLHKVRPYRWSMNL